MERTGEKRVRKKSRKASETEVSVEEPPPVKRRKKNAGGPSSSINGASGRAGSEVKRGRPPSERAKKKRLMVSLDVMEHRLNVGESGATPGSCTVTVGNGEGGGGGEGDGGKGGGKEGEEAAIRRPQMDIKFKNSKFMFSYLAINKKKSWRNFKQIIAAERALLWKPDDPTYSSIDAPPPVKPSKKYSDISGLTAKYTDPMTGMYFSTSEEFRCIRSLPPNIISGYLALRGKVPIM